MSVPHCSYVDSSYPCKRDSHFWVETEAYEEGAAGERWSSQIVTPPPTLPRTACQIHVGDVLKEQTYTVHPHAHFYVTPVDCV